MSLLISFGPFVFHHPKLFLREKKGTTILDTSGPGQIGTSGLGEIGTAGLDKDGTTGHGEAIG